MKINEIIVESEQLDEGWKQNIAAAAMAASAALGGGYSGDAAASDRDGRSATEYSQPSAAYELWLKRTADNQASKSDNSVSPRKLRNSSEPSYKYSNGNEYFGPLKNGIPNGKGIRIYSNAYFEGDFVNGQPEGKGKLTVAKTDPDSTFRKGDIIEGEFRNGEPIYGTLIFANTAWGNKYIGQFKNFSPFGKGTRTFVNGDKYVGEFKDGMENGKGTFTSADGTKYVGEWEDGRPNGKGTETFANGSKYVGEFKEGEFTGNGTFTTTKDNIKYVGEFKDGEFHGQGKLTLANGDSYFGEFSDSKYNGQGSLTYANGRTEAGTWKDGKLVSSSNQNNPPEGKASDINYDELARLRSEFRDAARAKEQAYQQEPTTKPNTVSPDQAREQAQAKEKAQLIRTLKMMTDEPEEKLQGETIDSLQDKISQAVKMLPKLN